MAKTIETRPQAGQASPAPPGGRGLVRALFLALSSLLALAVAAASVYGFGLYRYADSKRNVWNPPSQKFGADAKAVGGPCLDEACNYLILGSDSRAGLSKGEQVLFGSTADVPGRRSDTIILVRVDPRLDKVTVLHFPRDLWVKIPYQGWGKITSAYEGGPFRVAHAIEKLTGLHVNHFLAVNLAGFEGVVRALGSVRLCTDRPMVDPLTNLNLPHAGCYDLGPEQALGYVRTRHVCGDVIPDFSRIARQQQFLRAVLAKVLTPSMVFRAPALIRQVFPHIVVDPGFHPTEIIFLANALRGVTTGSVDFRSVPSTCCANIEGASVVQVQQPEAEKLFRRLREGKPPGRLGKELPGTPPSPANVKVRVFDKSSQGKAERVSGYLTDSGFDISPLGAAKRFQKYGSVILYRPDAERQAEVVHNFLSDLDMRQAPEGLLGEVAVGVVITSSYEGPPPEKPGGAGEGACG